MSRSLNATVPGEGMLGVSEGFIHRKGGVLGGIICDETVDSAAEGPAQCSGVLRGRRNGHVQPLRS